VTFTGVMQLAIEISGESRCNVSPSYGVAACKLTVA
jgi:hypothetical protein